MPRIFFLLIDSLCFSYGDLAPITPLGRSLACLAAIYGISIVSMLVSVLVDRYQRVYTRKRFFNEEDSEKMIFTDSFIRLKNHDECNENPIDIEKEFGSVSEYDDQIEEKQDNDERSGKVRFIIGYVSDEESENNQDKNDGNENEFINKVAQELFQLKSNK
jgi:hypothetical protein